MQYKNNKKGVKFLAAIMAFAMVLVAGFVIMDDGSDATTGSAQTATISGTIPSDKVIVPTGTAATDSYLINADVELTIPGKSTNNSVTINLYVEANKTVKIIGAAGEGNNNVTVCVIPSSTSSGTTSYLADDSKITLIGMTSGSIEAKTVSYGTETSATYSKIQISGNVGSGATLSLVSGGYYIIAANKTLESPGNISVTEFGVKVYKADTQKTTIYAAGADAGSISFSKANDVVVVAAGKAVVSQEENMVTISNVGNTTYTNAITVTAQGSGNDLTVPKMGGTLNLAGAVITINNGIFEKDSALTLTTGKANLVTIYDNSGTPVVLAFSSQLMELPTDISGTVGKYKVYGDVTQMQSKTLTGKGLEMNGSANLVINEGVSLTVGSITDATAKIRVFGQFTSTSSSLTNMKLLVGPEGYASGTAPNGTTNVKSGDDTSISGEVTSSTLGNAIIASGGTLTIPEGKTVTLEGDLGLNGQTLIVNGTLIIAKGASIFGIGNYVNTGDGSGEVVVLGTKGSIQNDGDFAKVNKITIVNKTGGANASAEYIDVQGVSGVEFVYKKDASNNPHLTVTGDVKAVKNIPAAVTAGIKIYAGAAISGEFTVGKDVTVTNGNATAFVDIMKGSVVTVNGSLAVTGSGYGFKLGELAEIVVNGSIPTDCSITVSTGKYALSNNAYTEDSSSSLPKFTVTSDAFTGVTIYTERVANSADVNYPFITKAYINGVIKDANVTASNTKPTVDLAQGTITIAEGEELIVKDDANLTATGNIVIEGKLTVMKETSALTTFKGAHYQITPSAGADTTGYYTTVKDAMAAIETANDKTVTINVGTLVDSVTVKAGQTVSITATGIDKDAVFTAEDDSNVTLYITATSTTFQGMVVIAGDANSSGIPTGYASLKTGADGTKTYSGFLVAVNNAAAGDVINIGSASVGTNTDRESLAIPAGVKVVVTTMLTINGNLTIPETAELVGGTVVVNGTTSKDAVIDVAGKLDLSAGALSGTNNKVTSSGEVIVQGLGDNMSGAYYVNTDGKYVLTSVANAVQKATTVNIIGTYTDMTDITLDKADIVIADGANVTLGKVTLVNKKITATGDLTATVTAKCGSDETTGAVSDATLEVVKSSAIIESTKVTSAAGVTVYTFKIDKIDGEMKVTQGTVTTGAVISSIATGSKFTVASGATFAVVNNVTIDGDNVEFVVDGTMTVKGATVLFDDCAATKAPTINGTLDIQKNGIVNAENLIVLGDVNVVNTETETGTFTVDTTAVQIGAPMETLGAGASVTGPMSIASGQFLIVYSGADMSKALINVTAGVSAAKSTEFYVNDVLYATVYSYNNTTAIITYLGGAVNTNGVIMPAMLNAIVGVDDVEKIAWKDADGNAAADSIKVGDVPALYATMNVSNAGVTISVGEGISLYVDGVRKTTSATAVPLSVGEHTVKAIVDPGYKGTTTITFNGATVSNGKIVVTADMVGAAKAPVLSVTGEITIDAGDTPAPAEKDSGMGITDYLLIVLVVLAAILVVVVAIRMMRS